MSVSFFLSWLQGFEYADYIHSEIPPQKCLGIILKLHLMMKLQF